MSETTGESSTASPKTRLKKAEGTPKAKRNSTNSIWMTRTLSVGRPDVSELVKAMGLWVSVLLKKLRDEPALKSKYPQRNYAIFLDEGLSEETEGSDKSIESAFPTVETITYFVANIVSAGELAPQSCIMAITYIDRIKDKLNISTRNWRRVCLCALILGCKVWEEHPVFNTDFGELFPEMSGKLLGQMEKHMLGLLKFEVGLTGAEYAKYYFQLRDLSPKALPNADQPLDDDQLKRLEERSNASNEWAQPKPKKQSQSANFNPKSKGVVVEKSADRLAELAKGFQKF